MGAVLAVLGAAVEGIWASFSETVIVCLLSPGAASWYAGAMAGAVKRDGVDKFSGQNATAGLFIQPIEPVLYTDLNFIDDHDQSFVSWDKVAGELTFAWSHKPLEQNNTLHQFFPRCAGFVDNQVVDDEGHKFALDYWTPNGSAHVYVPSGTFVSARWIKEISEDDVWDCRDRYDELPPEVPRPTPKVLTDEQKLDVQKAKEMKLLKTCDPEAWRKMVRGELAVQPDDLDLHGIKCDLPMQSFVANEDPHDPIFAFGVFDSDSSSRRSATVKSYFSVLPANDAAIEKYASNGADVLIRSMYADKITGKEQARILHSAMSSILATHHKQKKRSLVGRLMGRNTASADVVLDATVGAVIDAADSNEQKWTQMLAIGAVVRSVRESMQAGTAGKTELEAMNKMFERFN